MPIDEVFAWPKIPGDESCLPGHAWATLDETGVDRPILQVGRGASHVALDPERVYVVACGGHVAPSEVVDGANLVLYRDGGCRVEAQASCMCEGLLDVRPYLDIARQAEVEGGQPSPLADFLKGVHPSVSSWIDPKRDYKWLGNLYGAGNRVGPEPLEEDRDDVATARMLNPGLVLE